MSSLHSRFRAGNAFPDRHLGTDDVSIEITGSSATEKIRRIPEVYDRDKVKQDVGWAFLEQNTHFCHTAGSGSERLGGIETKRSESVREDQ